MSPQSSPPYVYITDAANTRAAYTFNNNVLMGAIIVIFLVFFFIFMLHLYAKWFFQRSSRSYILSRRITFIPPSAAASAHVNTGLEAAHVNTGLDKAAITQLPTFVYKATSPAYNLESGKLDESVVWRYPECAVCLSEFQENEKGRMLPSCKHSFHTECIDMWLFSHSTCPLCRTEVLPGMLNMASTHEQHHEGAREVIEPLPGTTEGNPNAVEYRCNVLLWGNQTQVVTQGPSSSLSRSLRMASARALPQITIDIPPIDSNWLVSARTPRDPSPQFACTTEQEACYSKSPGFRASIKKMLSRQSSRPKSSSQEVYEEPPK